MKYVSADDFGADAARVRESVREAVPVDRRVPTLAELREELAQIVKWDPGLTPAFAEFPQVKGAAKGGRGTSGEDLLARTAVARGEIILNGQVGVEDWNNRGPDLVTLAERPDGLVVKFYDNRASTATENAFSVPPLNRAFEDNLAGYREEWSRLAIDPARSEAEHKLFAAATKTLDEGRTSRVVTTYAGRVEGVTDRVVQSGVEFEDLARHPAAAAPPLGRPLPPAFAAISTQTITSKRPQAKHGDVAVYMHQGRAIRDTDGRLLSTHEHVEAHINLVLQTTNPETEQTSYNKAAYLRSATVTTPFDMAVEKTRLDMQLRDKLKDALKSGEPIDDELRKELGPDAAIQRTIAAREAVREKRTQAGVSTDDLDAVTDEKIRTACLLQQGAVAEAQRGEPLPVQFTEEYIDRMFDSVLKTHEKSAPAGPGASPLTTDSLDQARPLRPAFAATEKTPPSQPGPATETTASQPGVEPLDAVPRPRLGPR